MTPASTFAHVHAVLNGGQHRFRDTIASALGWWMDAGVDTPIDERPRNWLAPIVKPTPPEQPARSAALPAPAPDPAELPADLAALHGLLATGDYLPSAPPAVRRVAPTGDPASGLMIIADMPEPGDAEAGRLFSSETAKLFDAMLAAMGRNREGSYIAPLSPARLSGRGIDSASGERLAALMRRHVALAAPRGVILFGDETVRLLLGPDAAGRRGLLSLNHDGGIVPAIAIPHPRILRQQPARKAASWADMRRLIGEIAR